MPRYLTDYDDSASGWERALMAFLAEKERRSGSRRTVEGYSRMLQHFFGRLGKPPDQVTSQEVFAWAHGRGLSGKEPGPVTIGARLACLSSFYKFLIRMKAASANPCDALERPKVQHGPPRGLSAEEVRRLLEAMPETPAGLKDRTLVLTLTLRATGADAQLWAERRPFTPGAYAPSSLQALVRFPPRNQSAPVTPETFRL